MITIENMWELIERVLIKNRIREGHYKSEVQQNTKVTHTHTE